MTGDGGQKDRTNNFPLHWPGVCDTTTNVAMHSGQRGTRVFTGDSVFSAVTTQTVPATGAQNVR